MGEINFKSGFLEDILGAADNLIILLSPSGSIKLFNRKAEEVTGYRSEEALGKSWPETFVAREYQPDIRKVLDSASKGEPFARYAEYSILTKEGKEVSAAWNRTLIKDNQGKTAAILCIGQDLTLSKIVEQERDLTRTIVNSIAEGVFTVDAEGKITFFNKAAERITGWSVTDVLGNYCFDVFRADICHSGCALKKTLGMEREIRNLLVTILNREGRKVPISITTAVLRDEKGRMIGGLETFRDLSDVEELKKELSRKYTVEDIVSKNHLIHEIFNILPSIAESDSTVLIQGASGTGKELFAKAVHHLSQRSEKPFIKVNCGALPDTLLESELFGYVKGAFTDARHDKPGRFALADGGTLFLDEVGDMSPSLQVKLLRVLQEREYEPLGSVSPRKTDVRIIAATNGDLSTLVGKGTFRDDLFYRLNVVKIDLPPLSRRREDIPLLIHAFIQKFNARMEKEITGVSDEALQLLVNYHYPGNVRELENIIEHAFVLCRETVIGLDSLPKDLTLSVAAGPSVPSREKTPFDKAEFDIIEKALNEHQGNRTRAAKELGIDRSTLWRKMKKYGLQ
jgi:PAS domain S-box-containing protein